MNSTLKIKPLLLVLIIFQFAGCDLFVNEQNLSDSDLPEPFCDEVSEYFVVVENMPVLQGGLAELQRRVVYPELARKAGIEGRVTVQFVVSENGTVLCPRVIRGIGGGCDEAALNAVKEAKFSPGMQDDKAVKVRYSLPIVFRLPG